MALKLGERLDGLAGPGEHAEDVESDRLGEGSALADDDLVTGLDTEGGGDVRGEVLVALLVTGVLGDEVKVLAADDEGTCIPSVCLPSYPNSNFRPLPQQKVSGRVITYGASWWRRRCRSRYGHGSRPYQ